MDDRIHDGKAPAEEAGPAPASSAGPDASSRPIRLYELLARIERRPGLYLGIPTLVGLAHFLHGYQCALDARAAPDDPDWEHFRGFNDWLVELRGMPSATVGWWCNVAYWSSDDRAAFTEFFELLRQYRRERLADP